MSLFVPHEYQALTLPEAHPTKTQLARSVALCTEQPGTHWFEEAARVAVHAGGVLDINPLGVAELERRGVSARRLQLGYIPTWDRWGGDEAAERPIDLTFMGGHTERRALALARCGSFLHRRALSLHLVENSFPHRAGNRNFLSGDRKWRHLAGSKLALNIHRGELAYMEWHRVLDAMTNGSVVVTEHALGTAPLVPGEHFVSSRFDDLHLVCAALLDAPERVAAIRAEGYRYLRDELPLSRSIGALLEQAESIAARPLPRRVPGATTGAPHPKPPAMPQPGYLRRPATDAEVMRMALKHLVVELQGVRRELAKASAEQADDVTESYGRHGDDPPRVSVVVTLFNYEEHVEEALASVARSTFGDFEVIVVDDASRDGSADAARRALRAAPWMAATLILRGRNQGLAAGRNLGLARARGEYVFILDADNAVYPEALGTLADALDADPGASFAYGILERFNEDGPVGLESWLGWDPNRLRYGNFVDAMAMLRRAHVLAAGGYSLEPAMYGWEDFALWCALVDAGHHGVQVPGIVARYRVGVMSMIALASVDDRATWSAMVRRYRFLREGALSAAPAP